jgi:hypothetical protein
MWDLQLMRTRIDTKVDIWVSRGGVPAALRTLHLLHVCKGSGEPVIWLLCFTGCLETYCVLLVVDHAVLCLNLACGCCSPERFLLWFPACA